MGLSPIQSRMARAALGWTVRDAAGKAEVGVNTVARFETGGEALVRSVAALRKAYEMAGVHFLASGETSLDGGEGVRLSKQAGAE